MICIQHASSPHLFKQGHCKLLMGNTMRCSANIFLCLIRNVEVNSHQQVFLVQERSKKALNHFKCRQKQNINHKGHYSLHLTCLSTIYRDRRLLQIFETCLENRKLAFLCYKRKQLPHLILNALSVNHLFYLQLPLRILSLIILSKSQNQLI